MNRFLITVIAAAGAASAASAQAPIAPTPADSAAAALATVWVESLRPSLVQRLNNIEGLGVAIDREAFFNYFSEALKGSVAPMTPEAANAYMERRVEAATAAADSAYVQEQEAWLKEKAARPGVTVTPSGLIFEVITEGEGASPTRDDQVEVNYVGRLSSGEEFDNSRGTPVTFPVGRLIAGFTEGLTMMKPGGTYRIYIPSAIGYGKRGAGQKIPGGAALDFTIELLRVIPAESNETSKTTK